MNTAAVLLALAAAACYGVSSALQQRAASQERLHGMLDPRLITRLLRRRLWLLGWVTDAAGMGLQAFALRAGPLALVEPILVSGMFVAIPLEAALDRRRAHARDLAAVFVSAIGLAGFLASAQPRAGLPGPTLLGWLGVALGCGPVVAVCLIAAQRSKNTIRGGLLGIATGVLYGVAAALVKALTVRLLEDPLSLLANWRLYALIVVGFAAFVLNQNAFQSGSLAAPLTAITVLDPVTSVIIAITAFHEHLSTSGPRLAIELSAAVAMASGVWLASTARGRPTGR